MSFAYLAYGSQTYRMRINYKVVYSIFKAHIYSYFMYFINFYINVQTLG